MSGVSKEYSSWPVLPYQEPAIGWMTRKSHGKIPGLCGRICPLALYCELSPDMRLGLYVVVILESWFSKETNPIKDRGHPTYTPGLRLSSEHDCIH